MTASGTERYRAGDLAGAIAALSAAVRKKPTDEAARALLAEMMFFDGAFDRADTQLDAISNLHPEKAVGIALWRQLVRGAVAREQLFTEGRMPEFLDPPGEHVRLLLKALAELRGGDKAAVPALLQEAETLRPPVSGRINGGPFSDLRDLDDLFAPVLEVFTSTGKYYWVPLEMIETLAFDPPQRPLDLLWRQATLAVRGGTEGVVYIPAIYPQIPDDTRNDALKLGRASDWQEGPEGVFRGRGQRCFLAGDADVPIMEISEITISGPN